MCFETSQEVLIQQSQSKDNYIVSESWHAFRETVIKEM